ncbi:hypothetical protein P7C71_g6178, partial [Lecanoromycetidae sp. Uapishka_2]
MCGEFAGTFLFLFFAFTGTQVANSQTQGSTSTTIAQGSNPAQLLYIALCFGFSLAVNAWVFFRISGGLFNPAVTFGMVLVGAVPIVRGVLIVFSQIVGGIAAAGIVEVMFPGKLNVRTSLGAGTTKTQGLFIEMFLTTELVFTIFMLAAEKHKGTFIAPVGIGLALFIAELAARSFGPDVINAEFEDYHWIYWVGPLLGSLLAAGFYKLIKGLEYETANPGQDFDENETKIFDPERDVDRPMVNLVAPNESNSQPSKSSNPSRPISGDTLGRYEREDIPLETVRSSRSGGSQSQYPATKGIRRGSSPMPYLGSEAETSSPAGGFQGSSRNDDIVHGGAHYSQTANQLDPHVQGGSNDVGTYQAGPDAEAALPRSAGHV